jgi:hypothetical protein
MVEIRFRIPLIFRLGIKALNGFGLQRTLAVINLAKPFPNVSLLFITVSPNTIFNLKFVVWQYHPTKITNELDCIDHIINFLSFEKVWNVKPGVSKSHQLMTFKKRFFVLTCHLEV